MTSTPEIANGIDHQRARLIADAMSPDACRLLRGVVALRPSMLLSNVSARSMVPGLELVLWLLSRDLVALHQVDEEVGCDARTETRITAMGDAVLKLVPARAGTATQPPARDDEELHEHVR